VSVLYKRLAVKNAADKSKMDYATENEAEGSERNACRKVDSWICGGIIYKR
jgi:hypothetical protein